MTITFTALLCPPFIANIKSSQRQTNMLRRTILMGSIGADPMEIAKQHKLPHGVTDAKIAGAMLKPLRCSFQLSGIPLVCKHTESTHFS